MNAQKYAFGLWFLLGMFLFRVISQLVALTFNPSFLPPFDAWHSATLPYEVLVICQCVIIIFYSRIAWRFSKGTVSPKKQWGYGLLAFGGMYFAFMFGRLSLGVSLLAKHHWFNRPIPSFFHLVLAGFLIVVGLFHYREGKSQEMTLAH